MNISPAVYSGLCASLASLFGKLSGLEFEFLDVTVNIRKTLVQLIQQNPFQQGKTQNLPQSLVIEPWPAYLFITKALLFSIMVLLNSLVWTFFVKALHNSKTAVEATAVSTATNYALSGIFGFVFFNEVTGFLWWFGISLVVLGVIVVTHSSTDESKNLKSPPKEIDRTPSKRVAKKTALRDK